MHIIRTLNTLTADEIRYSSKYDNDTPKARNALSFDRLPIGFRRIRNQAIFQRTTVPPPMAPVAGFEKKKKQGPLNLPCDIISRILIISVFYALMKNTNYFHEKHKKTLRGTYVQMPPLSPVKNATTHRVLNYPHEMFVYSRFTRLVHRSQRTTSVTTVASGAAHACDTIRCSLSTTLNVTAANGHTTTAAACLHLPPWPRTLGRRARPPTELFTRHDERSHSLHRRPSAFRVRLA